MPDDRSIRGWTARPAPGRPTGTLWGKDGGTDPGSNRIASPCSAGMGNPRRIGRYDLAPQVTAFRGFHPWDILGSDLEPKTYTYLPTDPDLNPVSLRSVWGVRTDEMDVPHIIRVDVKGFRGQGKHRVSRRVRGVSPRFGGHSPLRCGGAEETPRCSFSRVSAGRCRIRNRRPGRFAGSRMQVHSNVLRCFQGLPDSW